MSNYKPWDIYARQLCSEGYGFPLFYPEHPNEQTDGPANIGDVGVIEEGRFNPFFNVRKEDSTLNYNGGVRKLPFIKLDVHPDMIQRSNNVVDGVVFRGREDIVHVEGGGAIGSNLATGASIGARVKVGSSDQEGACLVLKTPAKRKKILGGCLSALKYAARQEPKWSEYFESIGYDHRAHGIVLITGVTTTAGWGIAAYARGTKERTITFDVPLALYGSVSSELSFQNRDFPRMTLREGPSTLPRRFQGQSHLLQALDAAAPPKDQNIFLNYIKIKYRILGFLKSIKAEGERKEDGTHGAPPGAELGPGEEPGYDPLTDILDYILENTEDDVGIAIASTDDIQMLTGRQEWPDDVKTCLSQYQPKINIQIDDDVKRAYLSVEDMIIIRNKESFAPVIDALDPLLNPFEGEREEKEGMDPNQRKLLPGGAVDPGKSETHEELSSGSLLLARKQRDAVPDLEWPHRIFMKLGTERDAVIFMAVSPDGRYIASCFEDKSIRIWSLESNTLAYRLTDPDEDCDTIFSVAWSCDSTKLIAGNNNSNATIWLVEGDTDEIVAPAHVLIGHNADVQAVAMSPDGIKAATGSVNGSVKLWDVETGQASVNVEDLGGMVSRVTFSPDGKRLAVAADLGAWVYDTDTGTRLVELKGHSGLIWSLSFSSNGERLVTGSEDHTARVWETQTGDELVAIQEHSGPVWSATFSPDDKEVLTGSYDSLVAVCDSYTGQNRLQLKDRPSIVNVAAYTPGGDYVVAGCADGAIKIWRNADGEFICEIQGHKDRVKNLDFTPDGSKIVSSGDDGTVRVWDMLDIIRIA